MITVNASMPSKPRWFLRALVMLLALWPLAAVSEPRAYQRLLGRHAETIVTVSFAMSADMLGQQQRMHGEVEGTLIAGGLVLVPSLILNPLDLAREFMAQSDTPETELPNMSTGEIKVKMPGMDEPMEAEVITQDRDFGLAWLRLKEPSNGLRGLDLSDIAAPRLGETIYALALAPELYGYAPYIIESRVQGEVKVPFTAYMTSTGGKAMFNAKGQLVGYSVPKFSSSTMGALSGEGNSFGLLIPAARLKELTRRAEAHIAKP